MDGGPAQRIDAQVETGGSDRFHIDHMAQIVDVREDEVFFLRCPGLAGRGEWHTLYVAIAAAEKAVGAVLDPRGYVGVGWTAVGRIVLEAAIFRRIV